MLILERFTDAIGSHNVIPLDRRQMKLLPEKTGAAKI